MDTFALKEAGLTDGEIKVYLALLELGSSTTGPVIEKSGIAAICWREKTAVWIKQTAWMASALNKASDRIQLAIVSYPRAKSQGGDSQRTRS